MSFRTRPGHQWFLGLLVIGLLVQPIYAWGSQVATMVSDCSDGFGNNRVSGRLAGEFCVLANRQQQDVLRIPWSQDAWITVLLVVVFTCVAVALFVPRWSRWSHGLTMLAVPLLLLVGLHIAGRGYRRLDKGIGEFMLPWRGDFSPERGWTRVTDGWVLKPPPRGIWIPDVAGLPLGLAFFAGLALLVLVSALLADRYRTRHLVSQGEHDVS